MAAGILRVIPEANGGTEPVRPGVRLALLASSTSTLNIRLMVAYVSAKAKGRTDRRAELMPCLLRLCDNKYLVLPQVLADSLHLPRGPLHFYTFDFRAVSQAEIQWQCAL